METKQFLEASEFLKILDPFAEKFTFQVYDDKKHRKSKSLRKVLNGSLVECWPELIWYNKRQAGVHVTVQETDLTGRKKENIINIRSIYIDNDNAIDLKTLPLKPTMITESSPGNSHVYYALQKPLSTNNGHMGEFSDVMRRIVEMGGDKGAITLNHTLRLPGFLNWKRDVPTPSKIKHIETDFLMNPIRYDWSTLVSHFKPEKPSQEKILRDFFENKPDSTPIIIEPFKSAYVASALYTIDPDCEYPIWRDIGMGIHFASQGSRQGYELFKTWSERGENFSNQDWPNQWNAFKTELQQRPITLGTVFHHAKQSGWNSWYTMDVDDIERYVKQERHNCFEYFNQYYGLIPVGGNLMLIMHGKNELGFCGYELMSQRGANDRFAPLQIPTIKRTQRETRIIKERMYPKWLEWQDRNIYSGFVFAPTKEIEIDKRDYRLMKKEERYNTFIGLTDEGIPGDCDFVLNHIHTVWCKGNQERYEYIINWLARMYQYPGLPAETLIIITSRQGAGKNIILDEILKSWGRFGKTDNAGKNLTGDFNSILLDSVFILISEAAFDSTVVQRSIIKEIATQDRVSATKKFEDTREIRNCTHLICLSNEERPIRVDIGDRRHFIVACDNCYVGDFEYFAEFSRLIKEEKIMSKFIHYLRNRDISDFRPQIMPAMEKGLKSALIAHDPRALLGFLRTALEMDNFFYTLDPGLKDGYGMKEPNWIPTDRLFVAYQTHCGEQMAKKHRVEPFSSIGFSRKLIDIFGDHLKKRRVGKKETDGRRPYFYEAAPIETLRKDYDSYVGAPHDWGDDDEDLPDFLR